jgi:hypothetical protein
MLSPTPWSCQGERASVDRGLRGSKQDRSEGKYRQKWHRIEVMEHSWERLRVVVVRICMIFGICRVWGIFKA